MADKTFESNDDQTGSNRRTIVSMLALLVTTGCSSSRDDYYDNKAGYYGSYNNYRYYGRRTYARSPASRGRYRRY
jgi:hypothetical protein